MDGGVGAIIGLLVIGLIIVCNILFKRRKPDRSGPIYDGDGFDKDGYDVHGFDKLGYNRQGYTIEGKNAKGQYDRTQDIIGYQTSDFNRDGFFSIRRYPLVVTTHAEQRLNERIKPMGAQEINEQVYKAYRFGKSKRQIKKSSAFMIENIEKQHGEKIALIYQGYIYIFSEDNKLITVFKNDKIPL